MEAVCGIFSALNCVRRGICEKSSARSCLREASAPLPGQTVEIDGERSRWCKNQDIYTGDFRPKLGGFEKRRGHASVVVQAVFAPRQQDLLPEAFAVNDGFVLRPTRTVLQQREPEVCTAIG
jgi:hypothetical protein